MTNTGTTMDIRPTAVLDCRLVRTAVCRITDKNHSGCTLENLREASSNVIYDSDASKNFLKTQLVFPVRPGMAKMTCLNQPTNSPSNRIAFISSATWRGGRRYNPHPMAPILVSGHRSYQAKDCPHQGSALVSHCVAPSCKQT